MSDFKRKVVEAGCHLSQTEPESPWQMATYEGIFELKRRLGRKMTKTNNLKCFGMIVWSWKHTSAPTRIGIFSSWTG